MYLGYLGDVGPAYVDWVASVKAQGGSAVTWPFEDQYKGLSAASYPSARYATNYNAGLIDPNTPQQASGSNQYVYVLAGEAVQRASPQTASLWDRVLNATFTGGDKAANAVGLGGSLQALSDLLAKSGKYLAIGGGVILGALLLPSFLRRNPRGRRRHRRSGGRHA